VPAASRAKKNAAKTVSASNSSAVPTAEAASSEPAPPTTLLARFGLGSMSGTGSNVSPLLFARLRLESYSEAELREVFVRANTNADGALTAAELRAALRLTPLASEEVGQTAEVQAAASAGESGAGQQGRDPVVLLTGKRDAELEAAVQLVMASADGKVRLRTLV